MSEPLFEIKTEALSDAMGVNKNSVWERAKSFKKTKRVKRATLNEKPSNRKRAIWKEQTQSIRVSHAT